MKGWKTVRLNEIAESVDYGVTASAIDHPIGPKFLRITDIQNGTVNWENVPWCECDNCSTVDSRLNPGDIVFARTGATTGKSFLIQECPKDAIFASYLIRVRVGSLAEPRYISHFFQTPNYWAQITKSARGVAQPGVNATVLKELKIPLPSLEKQKRIADILDRAEALRSKRRASISQLDELIQSIFVDMFGSSIESNEATVQELGSLIEKDSSISYGIVQPGDEFPNGVSTIRPVDIIDNRLVYDAIKKIDPEIEKRYNRTRLKGDEILVTVRGTTGNTALTDKKCEGFNVTRGIAIIRPDEKIVDRVYLNEYLKSPLGSRFIQEHTKGATLRQINISDLKLMPIALPPINTQKKFVEFIKTVGKTREFQQQSLLEINNLFDSLTHEAFAGKLFSHQSFEHQMGNGGY